MFGHVSENSTQRTDSEWFVTRNRDVVLASQRGGKAHMAAGLAGHLLAVVPEQDSQFLTAEVAGQSHAATTSSRTMCRRIRAGRATSSKWH